MCIITKAFVSEEAVKNFKNGELWLRSVEYFRFYEGKTQDINECSPVCSPVFLFCAHMGEKDNSKYGPYFVSCDSNILFDSIKTRLGSNFISYQGPVSYDDSSNVEIAYNSVNDGFNCLFYKHKIFGDDEEFRMVFLAPIDKKFNDCEHIKFEYRKIIPGREPKDLVLIPGLENIFIGKIGKLDNKTLIYNFLDATDKNHPLPRFHNITTGDLPSLAGKLEEPFDPMSISPISKDILDIISKRGHERLNQGNKELSSPQDWWLNSLKNSNSAAYSLANYDYGDNFYIKMILSGIDIGEIIA